MNKIMDKILLTHGSGGRLTHELINGIFRKKFDNEILNSLDDSAVLQLPWLTDHSRICFTTDSYVVKPIFFPGGDIGKLSVCGTINDLAVMGAKPLFISCGVIIEEGFSINDLEKIVSSMKNTVDEAGVKIVTGDTKVVEKGSCDRIFINTAGIGIIKQNPDMSMNKIVPGDKVIINGTIGDHGITILQAREQFHFKTKIASDCAPLNHLIHKIITTGAKIKFMRDPTRGGLATTLNEITEGKNIGIVLEEKKIPVRNNVRSICELLGFDPLYIPNEGKVVVIVDKNDANEVIKVMKNDALGEQSQVIGEVIPSARGKVILSTVSGGTRIVDMLVGDQLPRIC
ncbi:MAG: hydrogenase expression/formation protein HypE [Elusimicrobia bacterium CG1_02_37_114]|nr:MAG: hydrogenase expression/formation protein HypE [Elusimicrobia bacterium CG1_02_37_114]